MHVNKSYIYAKSMDFFFFLVLHTCTVTFVVWQFNDTTALRLSFRRDMALSVAANVPAFCGIGIVPKSIAEDALLG